MTGVAIRAALMAAFLTAGCASDSNCPPTAGTICPWAGTGEAGFNGDGIHRLDTRLYWPVDLTFSRDGHAYVLDWNNHRVRRVDSNDRLETVIGTDFIGDGPADLSDLSPPGAPGTSINLNHPTQVLDWTADKMLLVSWHNHKLRSWDRATGLVQVICGAGPGFDGDGPVGQALLNQPSAARFGPDGRLYILDQRNQRIRAIDTFSGSGTITTVAGNGISGFSGDGSAPTTATVNFPTGTNPPPAGALDFDGDGRLYFADTLNHRVRRIDWKNNVIETVLGDGSTSVLNNPRDVETGPDGRIYVVDELNHRILALRPGDLSPEVVAGNGTVGNDGDGGPATLATLNRPAGIAFDTDGNMYIADAYNHRIRVVYGVAR